MLVVFSPDGGITLKVADFGLACTQLEHSGEPVSAYSAVGTPRWSPREIHPAAGHRLWTAEPYDAGKVDSAMLGNMLFFMKTGRLPTDRIVVTATPPAASVVAEPTQ